jgi:hypothetical protein
MSKSGEYSGGGDHAADHAAGAVLGAAFGGIMRVYIWGMIKIFGPDLATIITLAGGAWFIVSCLSALVTTMGPNGHPVSAVFLLPPLTFVVSLPCALIVAYFLAPGSKGVFGQVRTFLESTSLRVNPLMRGWTPEKIRGQLVKKYNHSPNALLRGDREAVARAWYDPARYPWIYKAIPIDIRRGVIWTGLTLGNYAPTELVWNHLNDDVLDEFVRVSGKGSIRLAAMVAVAAFVANFAGMDWQLVTVAAPYSGVPTWAGLGGVIHWAWDYSVPHFVNGLYLIYSFVVGLVVIPAGLFIITQRLAAKWLLGQGLSEWLAAVSIPLASPTRQAAVLHPTRIADRELEQIVYARKVEDATTRLATDPIIPICRATGTFRRRGDDEAPMPGQIIALDYEGLRQHLITLGGTGTGKTRRVLKPLARNILKINSAVRPIGMIVLDGKGVLHRDLLDLPEIQDRHDVVTIGTGPGQVGIDLIGGLSPIDVSALAETVSSQMLKSDGGDFWTASASLLIQNAAVIAQVMQADPLMDIYMGVPAWSLISIYRLAKLPMFSNDPDARNLSAILKRISDLRTELTEPSRLRDLVLSSETEAAVSYFRDAWGPMADQTKSGIGAHLDSVFGRFAGSGLLASTFGYGPTTGAISVDYALRGGIMLVAVGTAEWGSAGQMVAVWIKTLLFMRSRQLLQTERESRKYTLCVLLGDEYHMLATVGGQDSDATKWNTAREEGLAAVLATQSVVALHQKMDEIPAKNLLQQTSSKIFLATDEIETIRYAKEIAGQVLRGPIYNNRDMSFYETAETRELAVPDRSIPYSGWQFHSLFGPLGRFQFDTPLLSDAANVDTRFVHSQHGENKEAAHGAYLSSMQAAHWRASDQVRSAMSAVELTDKLDVADLMLGRDMAFVMIKRGNVDRMDIGDFAAFDDEETV